MAYGRGRFFAGWWKKAARWVRLSVLGRSPSEEAKMAKKTGVAPLSKEAGKQQRAKVKSLKDARKGSTRVKSK